MSCRFQCNGPSWAKNRKSVEDRTIDELQKRKTMVSIESNSVVEVGDDAEKMDLEIGEKKEGRRFDARPRLLDWRMRDRRGERELGVDGEGSQWWIVCADAFRGEVCRGSSPPAQAQAQKTAPRLFDGLMQTRHRPNFSPSECSHWLPQKIRRSANPQVKSHSQSSFIRLLFNQRESTESPQS